MSTEPFWETTLLDDMSDEQWELLCDGCARCCLNKLEDEDTGEVVFTRVSCKLLDTQSCQCTDYKNRFEQVPDCLSVRPLDALKLSWLPSSCAYRRLSENKPLASWHPLISGTPDSVLEAGISMSDACLNEQYVPMAELVRHVVFLDELDSDT